MLRIRRRGTLEQALKPDPQATRRPFRQQLGRIGLAAAVAGAFVLNIAFATGPYIPTDLKVVGRAKPTFVDIDRDGDLDAFVGEVDRGQVQFFRNTGSATSPFFVRQSAANNPLSVVNITNVQLRAAPAFVDIDNDGDLDVFVGSGLNTNGVFFFRNDTAAPVGSPVSFSQQAPPLVIPINVNYLGGFTPTFADIDKDGDFDALVGDDNGSIHFFRNTGTAASPTLTEQTGANNPFDGVDVGFDSVPTFTDIDNDSDKDVFIGTRTGEILFYSNNGAGAGIVPTFTSLSGVNNPLSGVNVGTAVDEFSSPAFANIDGDGDLDVYIGHTGGQTRFYRNVGSAAVPNFGTATAILDNPFDLGLVNNATSIETADVDGDGDKDVLLSLPAGTIDYYKNVGTGGQASFIRQTGGNNPFSVVILGADYLHPTLVDIDGDGDLDLVVGTKVDDDANPATTSIRFYRNTGSATSPVFVLEPRTAPTNPFGSLLQTGGNQSLTFGDFLDNDGDLDLIIGNNSGESFVFGQPGLPGQLEVYRNTGTRFVPSFTRELPDNTVVFLGLNNSVTNPSGGAGGEADPVFNFALTPRLIDYDGDGSLDLFIGQRFGYVLFFRNVGSTGGVLYFEQDDANNPFNGMDFSSYVRAGFIDLDGDGDQDSFFSSEDQNVVYWRNLGAPGTPTASVGTTTPTSVVVNWTQPALTPAIIHAPTNYRIERSTTGTGGWVQVGGELAGNITTLNDTGRTTGTTYFYRVTALYRSDSLLLNGSIFPQVVASNASNIVSATPGLLPLTTPTGLTATAAGKTQINLSWSDSNSDETGFRIERSADGTTGWSQVGTAAANATSFSDTGLTAGTTYYYRVLAVRNLETSAASNVANATTTADGATPPTYKAYLPLVIRP